MILCECNIKYVPLEETNQDMENQLKSANILNAKSLRKIEKVYVHLRGQFLGHLEAGLQSFGYLETSYDKDDNGETQQVVKEIIRNRSWWKDKVETQEQAIIRLKKVMFH
jgi:hypothetical protein